MWNSEDLKFHQGYITAIEELLNDSEFFSQGDL